jgi:hypothetical protein
MLQSYSLSLYDSDSSIPFRNSHAFLFYGTNGTKNYDVNYTYVLTRDYPPSGVMPTARSPNSAVSAYAIPNALTGFVPIEITNTQAKSVSTGLQQLLFVNFTNYRTFLNQYAENIRFYDSSWNPIYAWIEANAFCTSCVSTIWVKLDQSIPAYSSITIYLGFLPQWPVSNWMYSSSSYVGIAPQLTRSYGAFDNGKYVFNLYDNFSRTSLGSSWSVLGGSGLTVTVNNNITIDNRNNLHWWGVYRNDVSLGTPYALDMRLYSLTSIYSTIALANDSGSVINASGTDYIMSEYRYGDSPHRWGLEASGEQSVYGGTSPSQNAAYIFTEVATKSANFLMVNYISQLNGTGNSFSSGLHPTAGVYNSKVTIQWFRTRVAPPNNVMPGIAYSGVVRSHAFTLAYMCCFSSSQYTTAINYYGNLADHPVTAIGPQVYALSDSGNGAYRDDGNFDPTADTNLAHSLGLQVIPLVIAGDSFSVGNTGLYALLKNPQVLGTQLGNNLTSVANKYSFDGWQLDWETGINSSYIANMTAAIRAISSAMFPLPLSLTTYPYDYQGGGPFSIGAIANTDIAQINIQAYTNAKSDFAGDLNFMITQVPPINASKIQMGWVTGLTGILRLQVTA